MRNIKLTIEPRYSPEELKAVDNIIAKENKKAKTVKPGKELSKYIAKIKRT